jgi:gliding motility-associated-like protein
MRKFLMCALLCASLSGYSQLVNYQVRVIELMAEGDNNDGGGVAGGQDPTFYVWASEDVTTNWNADICTHFPGDIWQQWNPVNISLINGNGSSASLIYIEMDCWEKDPCGNVCDFVGSLSLSCLNPDDNRTVGGRVRVADIPFRNDPPCQWNQYQVMAPGSGTGSSFGDYYARVEIRWEYVAFDAGSDVEVCGNQIDLNAIGTGTWSILGGGIGGFIDVLDPQTTFTAATTNQLYNLQWSALPGCITAQNSSVNITFLESISANLQLTSPACRNITNSFAANGGASHYIWSVDDLSNVISSGSSNLFQSIPTGTEITVYVQLETASGCESTDSLTITLNPSPIVNLGSDTTICTGTSLQLNGTNQVTGLTNYLWNNGTTSPLLTTSTPGLYIIQATNIHSCTAVDSILISNYPVQPINLGSDVDYCLGNPALTFDAEALHTFQSYLWSDGSTNSTLTTSTFGNYYVTAVDDNSCISTDTIVVQPGSSFTTLFSSADTTIFLGSSITLVAPEGSSYLWESGETSSSVTLSPTENTSTSVTVTLPNGCYLIATGNILIDPNVILFIPNMFSPNGDGSNDNLLMYGGGIDAMLFKIVNRWGELVFSSDSFIEMLNQGWDGKFNGVDQPAGVYVWTLEGTLLDGSPISNLNKTTGTILLRR